MIQFVAHGRITARFNGYSQEVARQVGSQHTGQDETKGYGRPWITDVDGFVYKVHYPDNNFDWAAVHLLCRITDEDYLEHIPLGHASTTAVKEGDIVHRGQIMGKEGNHGLVFMGGRQITVQERQTGSKLGSHNHRGFRPVKRVKDAQPIKYYLEDKTGRQYQDSEGYFYEIKINDPLTKGWIDPLLFQPKLASERILLQILDAGAEQDFVRMKILGSIYKVLRAFNN